MITTINDVVNNDNRNNDDMADREAVLPDGSRLVPAARWRPQYSIIYYDII